MEFSVDLREAPGIIWVRLSGELDYPTSEKALREVWRVQQDSGLHAVIWDLRGAIVPAFSTDQLRQLAGVQRLRRPELPPAKAAFLVENDLAFGLGRMIAGLFSMAPVTFQVFRDPKEAVAWFKPEG